jgi:hypothetical protein
MFLKCYHYLYSIVESKVRCVDQITNENSKLDNFEQAFSTSEQTKELVTKTLLIFKCYQVDHKDIKCPFQWWGKHEVVFLLVSFLACQILGILRSQMKIERIIYLVSIFTNLRKCWLQSNCLERLIF